MQKQTETVKAMSLPTETTAEGPAFPDAQGRCHSPKKSGRTRLSRGDFIHLQNGWGQSIRAQVMCVPPGELKEFGVRAAAWQGAPWLWLSADSEGTLWTVEDGRA
jgi:hypothetical protein